MTVSILEPPNGGFRSETAKILTAVYLTTVSHFSDVGQVRAPQLFYTNFFLEKLVHLELPISPNGF
jgi:hypothetical protein